MGALKEVARSILMAPRKKEYEARLSYLSNTYDAYMLEQEKELMDKMKKGEASTLTSLEFVLEEGIKTGDADILIFAQSAQSVHLRERKPVRQRDKPVLDFFQFLRMRIVLRPVLAVHPG